MEPDVSIVIVNWNTRDLVVRCLAVLPEACHGLRYEVFLVDNASMDGSLEFVTSRFLELRVIKNTLNVGFAAANNQACREAKGRYLLLLNPDTEAQPNSIAEMVAYADGHSNIGAIGPNLLNTDGSDQRSCWRGYPGIGMAIVNSFYLWKIPWGPSSWVSEFHPRELHAPRDVDHVLGACMLIRRLAWDQVGSLDENFFLGSEETDWCYRAKKAGWRVLYYPLPKVIHHGQRSMWQQPGVMLPRMHSGICGFYRKHQRSQIGLAALCTVLWLGALARVALWMVRSMMTVDQGHRQVANNMTRGYVQVMRLLPRELFVSPPMSASNPGVTALPVDKTG